MDNHIKKLKGLISICNKASLLVSGEERTIEAIRSKKAYLVILSEDASKNTVKKFTNSTTYYEVPIYSFLDKNDLGKLISKDKRTSMAIIDENFANSMESVLKEMKNIS